MTKHILSGLSMRKTITWATPDNELKFEFVREGDEVEVHYYRPDEPDEVRTSYLSMATSPLVLDNAFDGGFVVYGTLRLIEDDALSVYGNLYYGPKGANQSEGVMAVL